jgi:hypothetical protein
MRSRVVSLFTSPFVVAVIVFVAASVAGLVLWAVTRHAEPNPPAPAAAAVLRYFSDLDEHDCQAAYQLLTDPLRSRAGSEDAFCIAAPATSNRAVVLSSFTPSGSSSAVVVVTVTKPDMSTRVDRVVALLQHGAWKVSDITPVSSSGVPLFDVDTAVMQVRNDYQQRTGVALPTLTCSAHGTEPAPSGTTVRCAFADAAGRTGTLDITVGSDGAFTWSTLPAPTPAPS